MGNKKQSNNWYNPLFPIKVGIVGLNILIQLNKILDQVYSSFYSHQIQTKSISNLNLKSNSKFQLIKERAFTEKKQTYFLKRGLPQLIPLVLVLRQNPLKVSKSMRERNHRIFRVKSLMTRLIQMNQMNQNQLKIGKVLKIQERERKYINNYQKSRFTNYKRIMRD